MVNLAEVVSLALLTTLGLGTGCYPTSFPLLPNRQERCSGIPVNPQAQSAQRLGNMVPGPQLRESWPIQASSPATDT